MTKIAITGGAGFIGSNLAATLIAQGHELTIIDDLSTGLLSNVDRKNSEFKELSITDASKLKKALKGSETIFHLGARGSVPRSIKNPVATHEVNATGTLNVLEAARETGAHVIFSSSSSVYGRNMQLPKEEKMWLGPITPYAASKLSAEAFVEAYGATYDFSTTIFRFFNVFGPKQRPDHQYAAVIPKWISAAIKGEPLNVFGDGKQSRDFTYVNDVVEILISCLSRPEIFKIPELNVGFGCPIELNKIIEILNKDFNDRTVKHSPSRVGDISRSLNDTTLFRSIFNDFQPTPITEAIKGTLDWFLRYKN
jgi:UDP-glucose 4-epimerase